MECQRKGKQRGQAARVIHLFGAVILGLSICFAHTVTAAGNKPLSPLAFLKSQELAHKNAKGEVYLGKVLTIHYPVNSAAVGKKYQKLLLELADALKTPERRSYRLVIRGYTDNTGPAWLNKRLSLKRAQEVKRVLVEKYYLDPSRIIVNGYGPVNPIASNKTTSGRALNRRSEIHVFGDVSEAVRMLLPPPAPRVAEKKAPRPKVVPRKKKEEGVPLFKQKKPAPVSKPKPRVVAKPQTRPTRGTPPVAGPLPEALRGITIRDYFVPSTEKRAGSIQAMLGHVVVLHRATREAYFARPGDIIYQNDAVYTLDNSRCRINFFDDDLVSMAANTEFAVDQYQDKREEKKKTSFFSMLKGKAMFFALRLFRYKQMAFRVKTPTAVVGVRGTKFGVYVRRIEEKTASEGCPMVASTDAAQAFMLASAGGGGAQYCTEAFCADGLLAVDGKEVPAGYKYDCETGQVVPYTPDYLRKFEEDTGVETEKRVKAEKKGERAIPFGLLDGSFAGAIGEQGDSTNDQNVPENTTSGRHIGYFSALLSDNYTLTLSNVYVSGSGQDFDSSSISATSVSTGGDLMTLNPGFVDNTTSYVTRIVTDSGYVDSGPLGTAYPITATELGHNSYMEWGYWTMTSAWTDPSTGQDFQVDNRAYYLFGLTTRDEVISGLTGVVGYSGNAYGTFWRALSNGGGILMNGNFNCQVDFTSGNVSGFNLAVSGGGYGASIIGAGGALNGGQFSLSGGTWRLSTPAAGSITANQHSGAGSFYGPNAEYVGGAWGMTDGRGHGATGIFQGSTQ